MQSPSLAINQSSVRSGANRGRRIVPVDAARGAVMLFSCLAHFSWWIRPQYPQWADVLSALGMVATPTFLMTSGAMVGMLCASGAHQVDKLKWQFLNRGLFLLTVGHVLISLAEAHENHSFVRTLTGASVVDEIGLCTIVAAYAVRTLADARRCAKAAAIALAAFLFAWAVVLAWHPHSVELLGLKQMTVGGEIGHQPLHIYTAPFVQYMAIYALGLPLGHLFAGYASGRLPEALLPRRLVKIGLAAVVGACVFHFGARALLRPDSYAASATFHITAKSPPSPVYLAFFAGMGMLLIASLFWCWNYARERVGGMIEWVAVIGRASLFVFILQYFLYWTLPDLLGITPNRYCVLVFIGNVLIIRYAAGLWGYLGGNRWMTFNLGKQRRASDG